MRKIFALFTAAFVLFSILCFGVTFTHAIAVTSAGISNPGSVDQGGTYSVSYTVATNDAMAASLAISVSGGGVFAGATSSASVSGNSIVLGGVDGVTSINGTISFTVNQAVPVTIAISGDVSSVNDFTVAPVGTSTTITVRSAEEIAAAQQAAAAEAARQASIQAEQASINASIAESQAIIDASILAEQQSIQAEQASEEEERNASIAASAAEEESLLAESASIEAAASEEAESIAQSIAESESMEDLTRAFKVGENYFVPMDYSANRFIFAVASTLVDPPEGFAKSELIVNRQDVLAYRRAGATDSNIYLVYGNFENEDPAFYYYDTESGLLMPYAAVNGEIGTISASSEAEPETESDGGPGTSLEDKLIVAGLAMVFGAAITLVISMLVNKRRKNSPNEEKVGFDEVEAELDHADEKEMLPEPDDRPYDPNADITSEINMIKENLGITSNSVIEAQKEERASLMGAETPVISEADMELIDKLSVNSSPIGAIPEPPDPFGGLPGGIIDEAALNTAGTVSQTPGGIIDEAAISGGYDGGFETEILSDLGSDMFR